MSRVSLFHVAASALALSIAAPAMAQDAEETPEWDVSNPPLPTRPVTIDVTDGSQVSISGSVLTINPTSNLETDKNYAIQISTTAIVDLFGNDFFFGPTFLTRANHNGCAMGVVSTEKTAIVSAQLLEADPDVRLDIAQHMADMDRAIGVGQCCGDKNLMGGMSHG